MLHIKVCAGPFCKAKAGGTSVADTLKGSACGRDINITTVGCMRRCACGPNVQIGNAAPREVDPSEEGCRTLLAAALPTKSNFWRFWEIWGAAIVASLYGVPMVSDKED